MVPIISIVGKSDSGKTTLIEKLVPELKKRGYAVGTIKHDAHKFDIDHPRKDSWRHKQAGATATAISSPEKAAIIKSVERELTLDEIAASYLADMDIILTEGYKREAKPKVEVLTNGDNELISPPDEVFLVAADHLPELGPSAVKRDDAGAVADAIENKFLKRRRGDGVLLIVDGSPVPLNRIMRTMVGDTIRGMISSLKGVDNPEQVEIRLTNNKEK